MLTERYDFTKEEIKNMMETLHKKTAKEALEEWAYLSYDMRHNASVYIKKVGNTFVEIGETP